MGMTRAALMLLALGLPVASASFGCSDEAPTESLDADADAGAAIDPDVGPAFRSGSPCRSDSDCAGGLRCLYWPGASTEGECSTCPVVFDAALYMICSCDGTSRARSCTDYPWSHNESPVEIVDGGMRYRSPGEPCLTPPRPACDAGI